MNRFETNIRGKERTHTHTHTHHHHHHQHRWQDRGREQKESCFYIPFRWDEKKEWEIKRQKECVSERTRKREIWGWERTNERTTYKRRRNKSFNRPFILFVMHHKSINVWSIDFNLTKKNINKKERNQESETGNCSDNSHNFYPYSLLFFLFAYTHTHAHTNRDCYNIFGAR